MSQSDSIIKILITQGTARIDGDSFDIYDFLPGYLLKIISYQSFDNFVLNFFEKMAFFKSGKLNN